MFDFRLQVFYKAAKRLNFTKAAQELYITQPAVTKHIHEIESHYKVKLFDRNGSKLKLTEAGKILLKYSEDVFAVYRNLEFEMNSLTLQQKGILRIGASTTVAQYVLSPLLADFHQKFKDIDIKLLTGNTEQIEKAILKKEIDFGIIEGRSKQNAIKYIEFKKDEIVLVSRINNPLAKKQSIKIDLLKEIPLLLREPGSGTLEVIAHTLKSFNIKIDQLKIEMQLSSTESIKQYLLNSNCMAFLSIHSVLKELKNSEFSIVEIEEFTIDRLFYFIQLQGQIESLPEMFMKFAQHYNFK